MDIIGQYLVMNVYDLLFIYFQPFSLPRTSVGKEWYLVTWLGAAVGGVLEICTVSRDRRCWNCVLCRYMSLVTVSNIFIGQVLRRSEILF